MKKLFFGMASFIFALVIANIFGLANFFGLSIEAQVYLALFGSGYIAIYCFVLFGLCIYKIVKNKSVIAGIFLIPSLLMVLFGSWTFSMYRRNASVIIEAVKERQKTEDVSKQAEESGTVAKITEIISVEQFNTLIKNSEMPVVVKCSAEWCPPCKMMKPIYKVAAMHYEDKITFVEFDNDKLPELSKQLNVQALPTIVGFKNGVEVLRISGAKGQKEFIQDLQKLVA